MHLNLSPLSGVPMDRTPVEMVERKGIGHPDSVCDAVAERLSLSLSRFYLQRFGRILHHNVDKVLLWGGAARPRFGGGEVTEPMEIYLCGRAVTRHEGVAVPVQELAVEGTRQWFREHFHALDPERHLRVHSLVRPGSADLGELYGRSGGARVALANDTSIGAGFAPLSRLEALVYDVERDLNPEQGRRDEPAFGEDVKVMGVRVASRTWLTVACAMVDRHLRDLDQYLECGSALGERVRALAAGRDAGEVEVSVNSADDPGRGSVYLTVTGTSAESGDDGEAGRGNRANGLITPYRPMTMESVAGKNPVSHVGKLYNLCATRMAAELVAEVPGVAAAECYLVSRIGHPVDDPQVVDVRVRAPEGGAGPALHARVEEIVRGHLAGVAGLWRELIEGGVRVDEPLPAESLRARLAREYRRERREMLRVIAQEARETAGSTGRGKFSPAVMAAMERVPRHAFVTPEWTPAAYADGPLSIGHGQTISQPYIVALMTELSEVGPRSRVLEVGTGCGYQSAVLAEIAAEVYTVELIPALAEAARARLRRLGYSNVHVRAGDGYEGWPEHAPYDAILVTAGAREIPPPLLAQLRPGGRMIIPLGTPFGGQTLTRVTKDASGTPHRQAMLPVAFVPFCRGPVGPG